MNNTKRCWAPRTVEPNLMALLAVPVGSKQEMTPGLHRILMQDKIERLLNEAGEVRAREALAMSPEHLPELLLIQQSNEPSNWAQAILNSDLMLDKMRRINWQRETTGMPIPQSEITEELSEQTLVSLLETL